MQYWDCLTIIFISVVVSFASEGLSWLLVYRREDYQRLKASLEKAGKSLDLAKAQPIDPSKQKQKDKRVAELDELVKAKARELTAVKFRSTLVAMATVVGMYSLLSNTFTGAVVAKLPFQPIPLVQGITHRGLAGADMTDCSFFFIYILCQISVRGNIQKLLGFAPPSKYDSAANMFAPPEAK